MLISHKYKFIFIRTVKTAGTSIEIALAKFMSDKDIVTDIKPTFKDHKPRNQILGNKKFFNHMPGQEIKKCIGKKIYNTYFKFCVEREPVDKCISHFSMFKNSPHHKSKITEMSWSEYINSNYLPIDYLKYTDVSKNLIVDKILKYENLDFELKETLKKLGIKFNKLNVKAKANYRIKIDVSNNDKIKIYEAFKESNQYTGYKINKFI